MESSTSITTQTPEPRRQVGNRSRATLRAAGVVDEAYYSDERPSCGPRLSEAPPTGVLTWVLGEMAFYYGACCLYHRSPPPYQEKMW